jgi:hypothetical protein
MLAALDQFLEGRIERVRELEPRSDEEFEHMRDQMQQRLDEEELERERQLASTALSISKVARFVGAIRSELLSQRRESLTVLLETAAAVGQVDHIESFGLDTLVPRWYFAETDVYAEPEEFAGQVVLSLLRGEQETVLRTVLPELSSRSELPLASVHEVVEQSVLAHGDHKLVVVTNSYQAVDMLIAGAGQVDGELVGSVAGAPVIRTYDDREPYIALLDPMGAPWVARAPAVPTLPSDELLEDVSVIVGVSELSEDEMDEIVEKEPRTAMEEARLRSRVRVRVQELFGVHLEGPDRVMAWRLPERTW